ncbi:MAG: hypothetical protein QM752_01615 [Gammaproteobacteria bacterium]
MSGKEHSLELTDMKILAERKKAQEKRKKEREQIEERNKSLWQELAKYNFNIPLSWSWGKQYDAAMLLQRDKEERTALKQTVECATHNAFTKKP